MGRVATFPVCTILLAGGLGLAFWKTAPPNAVDPIQFELTQARGLRFVSNSGATARKYQPQTMLAGVALTDYDNDGRLDLYFVNGATMPGLVKSSEAYWNRLFRNNGDGSFTDVTDQAGVKGRGYDIAVAVADYDNDGYEDIFVAGVRGNILYHNNHDGTFTDVSERSGIRKSIGKGMGVAVADFDGDGWPDIFVANDNEPNQLFHNERDGTFNAVAVENGVAYTENGTAVAGMGAEARDIDNDSWPDIFETALVKETMPLFRNLGKGFFQEITRESGVTSAPRNKGGWSNGVFDFNNDGWKDLFVAAAHVLDAGGNRRASVEQSNMVLANLQNGKFSDVSSRAGSDF